jgi:hypothetical protein
MAVPLHKELNRIRISSTGWRVDRQTEHSRFNGQTLKPSSGIALLTGGAYQIPIE